MLRFELQSASIKATLGLAIFSASLSGCSGSTTSSLCQGPQTLAVVGSSTGPSAFSDGLQKNASPYSSSSTYLYFSANNQPSTNGQNGAISTVIGTPILMGSNGTTISAGPLTAIVVYEALEQAFLAGYSSSVSGLQLGVTYTASVASLTGSPGGCVYGAQSLGSFQTN